VSDDEDLYSDEPQFWDEKRGLSRSYSLDGWSTLPQLSCRVGFTEALVADPRVHDWLYRWFDQRYDPHGIRDAVYLGTADGRMLLDSACDFLTGIGFFREWLSEELVNILADMEHSGADPALTPHSLHRRMEGLLAEQRAGPLAAVDKISLDFRFRLQPGESFGDALERFKSEAGHFRVHLDAFEYFLEMEAEVNALTTYDTHRQMDVDAWRRSGRWFYEAVVRQPPSSHMDIAWAEWSNAEAFRDILPSAARREAIHEAKASSVSKAVRQAAAWLVDDAPPGELLPFPLE
jgi:hypothetical protein